MKWIGPTIHSVSMNQARGTTEPREFLTRREWAKMLECSFRAKKYFMARTFHFMQPYNMVFNVHKIICECIPAAPQDNRLWKEKYVVHFVLAFMQSEQSIVLIFVSNQSRMQRDQESSISTKGAKSQHADDLRQNHDFINHLPNFKDGQSWAQ